MANDLQKTAGSASKPFSELIKSRVANVLTGKKFDEFVTAMVNLSQINPALLKCVPDSLIASGLQAQSLNLSLHPSMGQAWIIPFNDTKRGVTLATFQIGYKGYLQLAMRSGQYADITVSEIKEGEFVSFSPITEKFQFVDLPPDVDRDSLATVGYYVAFEYTNGFKKALYWPRLKMQTHAEKYSFAYANDLKRGYKNSFWSKDFDSMAKKTMLRQILTKWGIMSSDLIQTALVRDYQAADENGDWGGYPDQEPEEPGESRLEELIAMTMSVYDDRGLILSYIEKSSAARNISLDAFAEVAIERFDDFSKAFSGWIIKNHSPKKTIEARAEMVAEPKEKAKPNREKKATEEAPPADDGQSEGPSPFDDIPLPDDRHALLDAINDELKRLGQPKDALPSDLAEIYGGDPGDVDDKEDLKQLLNELKERK